MLSMPFQPRPATEPSSPAERRSGLVFGGVFLLVLLAVAFPEMPVQGLLGIVWAGAGLLMSLLPPEHRLPRAWILLAGGFVAFAALGFLPREWFPIPDWRTGLEALGLDTGPHGFLEPEVACEKLAGFAVTAVVALYLLGHRIHSGDHHRILIGFGLGMGLWIVAALVLREPGGVFGFFPNRNHSATLLAMAAFAGLGALAHAVRRKDVWKIGLSLPPTCLAFWALLVVSASRAGIVLAVVGCVAWLWLTGLRSFRGNAGKALVLLLIAVGGIFLIVDSTAKKRLTETVGKLSPAGAEATATPETPFAEAPVAQVALSMDGRIPIFLDTLTMVRREPWPGVGPGQFARVFPQYWERTDAPNNSQCLHPESDWLMMLAETGWPATLCLAAGVGAVFFSAVRQMRKGRSGFLRTGSLIAALLLCVHGIFDVPGHRVGLAWAAAWLLAMALRAQGVDADGRENGPSRMARGVWRVLGLVILAGGLALLAAQWRGTALLPSVRAQRHMWNAKNLYDQDQAAYDKAVVEGRDYQPAPEQDPLEAALREVAAAIRITPLDPHPHYVRGALALHYDDKQEMARRAFAIQRRLVPTRVNLPLEQALAWSKQGPEEVGALWSEALRRARAEEARFPDSNHGVRNTFSRAMHDAGGSEALVLELLKTAGTDAGLLELWARSAPAGLLDREMPRMLADSASPAARVPLFGIWKSRGSKDAASNFARSRPDLGLSSP